MTLSAVSRRVPVQARSEQRLRAILEAARLVFSEVGYASATMTEIARRVGVSEATIFTYFASKRDLCVRVLGNWYDEIIAQVESELPLIDGTRSRFAYLVRTHLYRLTVDGTGLCALILSEGREKDDKFGDVIVELQRRYTAPMMRVLAEGVASGDVRDDMPLGLLRSAIYGPMEHVLWDAVRKQKTVDIEATAASLSDLLWQGLVPPNARQAALKQLRNDIVGAVKRFEAAESK
ncbi:TetR/AcrR family transcriptional regulator [Paraburkholderia bryophila]|uniref:TetR/AcrR family transcriptional regulator n=1 Tax=Paraburkholderia bryophila TaxID=420952 RepID=UPI0023499516|nr:TetR/AcrR family transcriptional regulator [Paraburkholderia bryophila]WCM18578.1 TetR/AcrR family transcriptional regulator [Paraburkholderia bryophila]